MPYEIIRDANNNYSVINSTTKLVHHDNQTLEQADHKLQVLQLAEEVATLVAVDTANTAKRKRGASTLLSGQTTLAVTHGLATTPNVVNIMFAEQGTSDYGRWWVSAIGATQFTLNVSADPGASNLDFTWEVATL